MGSKSGRNAAVHSEVESDQLQIRSGSLHPNVPPLIKKTHVRDVKRGKSSSGRNYFHYPPAKALRLAITSGENGENRAGKSCFPRFRGPPRFSRTPRGRSEATRSSGKAKKKTSNCNLVIGRNANQLTLTSDSVQGWDHAQERAFSRCSCELPADETPEEEKPSSFLSLLPNYSVDQEVPLVQGGVNTNRHLHSSVCSCRCASSLCIPAQTCLPNRP